MAQYKGMSMVPIEAHRCICERCSHSWYAFNPPKTCSKCRSPYWNVPRTSVAEKKIAVEPPKQEDKKEEISNLQSIIDSIKEKSEKHTPSYTSGYTSPQASTWEEPTIS